MSDEVIEWSHDNYDQELAKEFNLFKLSQFTKKYWQQSSRSPFELFIELVILKDSSLKNATLILEKIKQSCGSVDPSKFQITDKTLNKWGCSNESIFLIRQVLKLETHTVESILSLKGLGIWLHKALKVISEEEDDIFFSDDVLIRKNMSSLFLRKNTMSIMECKKISSVWIGYRTQISNFLWSITSEGIDKIIDFKPVDDDSVCELLESDFKRYKLN
jgi:hypothetical protein